MRILQCYRFHMGTKIPFPQWPDIVETFLSQQQLSHRMFHYCLEDYDNSENWQAVMDGTECETCRRSEFVCEWCRKQAADYLRKGTACERAVKENPFLGQIKKQESCGNPIQSLNNFSEESNHSKAGIYAILSKIYRRYGFVDTSLIYRDIDFFSRRVPTPPPGEEYLMNGYEGSGITLHRSCSPNDNGIILTIESHYPGDVPDGAPYADALGALLPGIKRTSTTKILMDQEERCRCEELNKAAQPLVKQAKEFFVALMPEEKGNDEPEAKVSVASWLKKLGKRYGYTYRGYHDYIYFMEKRQPNGHYICLEFVSNPSCPSADPYVFLCGLGFTHKLWVDGFGPQNPRDASEYFTRLFDTLDQAAQTVFPAILALYPTTPDWFVPPRES